ncbi:MAG: pantetheine-phosphate adenylyltransferase, partial [Thermomicrobiales bacterium]|nr:pantetheine-phosphate adenylyltransferase [Thermomicrobiales bacterium]
FFTHDDRVTMARDAVAHLANVRVESFSGLTVDFARDQNASVIVRGLRAVSDFEYEFKLAHMNHHLAPEIEVVCLMTSSRNSFVSSSMIREVASLGGDITGLVPPNVEAILRERFDARVAERAVSS